MAKVGGVAGMFKGLNYHPLGKQPEQHQNPSQVSLSGQYSLNYTPRECGHLEQVTVKLNSLILFRWYAMSFSILSQK